MRSYTKFDSGLKEAVSKTAGEINPSENMFAEISKRIESENRRKCYMKMNKLSRRKGLLVACMLLVLTTVTCFAASRIVSVTGGLDNSKFETCPSERQMEKAAGFSPKYVEEFKNGYQFKIAFVGELEGNDAQKNSVTMIKTVDFTYLKEDAEIFIEVMEKPSNSVEFPELEGEEIITLRGQIVYYYDYLNKLKPVDYVMTEQDKIDEANGTYVFSFGEDYDCIKHIQMIEWEEDGIRYSLNCFDDKLTKEELLKMAEEIIEK